MVKERTERIILHIDMDAFFTQIEERENPQFKERPIVVGSDPKQGKRRGVVSTCNYEARKYGIRSAMPISKAFQLCPTAIFLPVDMFLYEKVSQSIMEILKKYSPLFELMSLDEAYLDLSFLKTLKKAKDIAKEIKKEILKKEKLTCTIGIGPNKLISKIACQKAKPDGLEVVKQGEVLSFLLKLDIQEIPGIGPKTGQRLRDLRINTIGELRKVSLRDLLDIFGKAGASFFEKSRGVDNSPVQNEAKVKSIGREITFEEDTRKSEIIFPAFDSMVKEVYQEISVNNFHFKTITVVCRFSFWETHTKAKTLSKAVQDIYTLKKEGKKLLLRFLVEDPKPVRLIGLRVKVLP